MATASSAADGAIDWPTASKPSTDDEQVAPREREWKGCRARQAQRRAEHQQQHGRYVGRHGVHRPAGHEDREEHHVEDQQPTENRPHVGPACGPSELTRSSPDALRRSSARSTTARLMRSPRPSLTRARPRPIHSIDASTICSSSVQPRRDGDRRSERLQLLLGAQELDHLVRQVVGPAPGPQQDARSHRHGRPRTRRSHRSRPRGRRPLPPRAPSWATPPMRTRAPGRPSRRTPSRCRRGTRPRGCEAHRPWTRPPHRRTVRRPPSGTTRPTSRPRPAWPPRARPRVASAGSAFPPSRRPPLRTTCRTNVGPPRGDGRLRNRSTSMPLGMIAICSGRARLSATSSSAVALAHGHDPVAGTGGAPLRGEQDPALRARHVGVHRQAMTCVDDHGDLRPPGSDPPDHPRLRRMGVHHVEPAVADQTTDLAVGARIVQWRDLTDEMR